VIEVTAQELAAELARVKAELSSFKKGMETRLAVSKKKTSDMETRLAALERAFGVMGERPDEYPTKENINDWCADYISPALRNVDEKLETVDWLVEREWEREKEQQYWEKEAKMMNRDLVELHTAMEKLEKDMQPSPGISVAEGKRALETAIGGTPKKRRIGSYGTIPDI
jgi:6-pyruvoyl-tetrahydropterin synthase